MIALAVAVGLTTLAGHVRAGLIVDVSQVGANVVATGSGSIDLSVLTQVGTGGSQPLVWAQEGWVFVRALTSDKVYTGLTGPSSFGTGALTFPSGGGTGDGFGIEASFSSFGAPTLYLPETYLSGSVISGSATYDNTTIAALGLAPGTYTYTATGVGNTFTVNIGSVPEPSSLTTASTAVGLIGGLAVYRRRRNKR